MANNNEQKYIAKLMSYDSTVPVDFWRWSKNNVKDFQNEVIELLANTLPASKENLASFDKFVIIKTEPDGTELFTEVEIMAGDFLIDIADKYKEKHNHFPYEDKFDSECWKIVTDGQKERIEKNNNRRVFTVDDCILSVVDRADFLIESEHYVGEKKVKDEFKIRETLNKENLKPVRFIYEGNGFMGESIYESFVCKKNDNSGFKYLMVPHNTEYYKGFDKLVLSEKTFSDIEECQNDLIETLVNQKVNHNYRIETNTSQFWNIPQKYKQPLLSYIEKNEKEICDKTEAFLKSHHEIEPYEKMKDNIALYLIREPNAVDFNSPEWIKKFEKIELSISNPLLADTIEVNIQKENKLMENNKNEIIEQMKKDSAFLLETYGNKKAVDAAVKKASILDFVSKDKNRRFMQGVFYEDGFAIATDGRVLIKQKTSYPAEYEGKIIDPTNGKEIEGQYPNYKRVFPAKENLVDRSNRLAHITDYLVYATVATAISPKDLTIPVQFDNTFVNGKYLQTALAFAREKGFNKVYQEDNYKLIDIPELDKDGKEIFKFYTYDESSDNEYRYKYHSFEELPDKVKNLVTPMKNELKNEKKFFELNDGTVWWYGRVEKSVREPESDASKPLTRVIEFDSPDGSSILIMPINGPEKGEDVYIDSNGILKNYEESDSIKVKLLGKGDDFYKNVVKTLVKDTKYESADIDTLYKKNFELALEKQNPAIFPKDKKDCLIYATTMTYADALGQSFDKNNIVFEEGQSVATWEQFVFNMYVEKVKDLVKNPVKLFWNEHGAIDADYTIRKAKEDKIIKERELGFEELIQNEFGDALKAQKQEAPAVSETTESTIEKGNPESKEKKYSFFVKDTSEFGSDFEPLKNLSAEEAVKLFQKLNKSDVSKDRFGIALSIPGDKVFGEWAKDGISIAVLNGEQKVDFGIFGETFITQLKEKNKRSRTYIDAYKELYTVFENARKENSESYDVVHPDFLFAKENELFEQIEVESKEQENKIHPKEIESDVELYNESFEYYKNSIIVSDYPRFNLMLEDIKKEREYFSKYNEKESSHKRLLELKAKEDFINSVSEEYKRIYEETFKDKEIIKPATLEEILSVMEFTPEFTEDGKIKVYDQQRNEYVDNRSDLPSFDEDKWTFTSAAEIFERMDIYINDYYIHDMQEQLEGVGVEITGNETLSDLCKLYQSELEKGNDKLSIGELNLAMGIVHPETVILQEEVIKQEQSNNKSSQENEIHPKFLVFGDTPDEKIVELKEHLSMNGYDIKWKDKTEDNNFTEFTCSIDDKSYIQTILEDRGIDYGYELGLLATGYDAAWLNENEVLDAEVVTKEEFKRINEIREKEFKDLKLPYIKIDFTEGSTSNHKPARMESGTVLGLKESEELLKKLNNRFNTFLKCDITVYFPDAKNNEPGSYSLRYDFCNDKRTLDNGKEVPFEREGLSDYIRKTCSYSEVLEKYEQQWQKINAQNITEEQKKLVADIIAPNFEKLKERYKEQCENLSSILKNDKKLKSSWIINASDAASSKESIETMQEAIENNFKRYAGICMNHIADYLDENKDLSYKDEFLNYAKHEISNMLQDVKYGESRNAKFGEHGYDFDFSLWRKSLEKVMDASEYDSFLKERLQAEELRYKETRNAAKTQSVNLSDLPAEELQKSFRASLENFNHEKFFDVYHSSYDEYYNTDSKELLKEQSENMWKFDELMKSNPQFKETVSSLVEERKDTFSSDRECAAVVKAFETMGIVLEKTVTQDEMIDSEVDVSKQPELKTYHILKEEDVKNLEIISDEDFSDIVDSNIPQSQEKSSDESLQNLFSIKGEKYSFSDAERLLKEDIASIFEELDSGEKEENLTLNGVKVYGNPEKDGKIKLLVEFDSKNPENKWSEDSVFNAIAEENITFNGMEVDVNPITPEKSGTIEEYLSRLERLGAVSEAEAIEKQAEFIASREEVKTDKKIDDIPKSVNKTPDSVLDKKDKILPFSIIDNREKGRVNIKFDTVENNPVFNNILKELKSNGWKFAPSTKQWYPVGNAVKSASDFANRLQEKYTEIRNPNMEKPMDLGSEKSPYDGIRFFDRNYNESEDFANFFNSNLHILKKGKESAITKEDAVTILKAIGYEKDGIVEQRKLRVGLDNKDKIVILTSENGNVKTEKIELSDILEFAKNKAEERVIESKQMLQNYLGKEPVVKKDLQDIFISLYETCVTQSEEIDLKMKLLYDSFIGKKHEQVKEAVLYQRTSYRGWEISADKDFKKSVYFRPFEQTDRSGYILMSGKEIKDGFWQEKFVREMLKSNNWDEKSALIETLTTLASDKETCTSLGIKEQQSLNGFFSSLDKIIHVENDTDIKNELMESLLGPSEAHKVSKESTKDLSVGDKLGEDTVSDLFWISDGVCQATLSREVNGVASAQNYFVIDNSIINQLDDELKELVVSFDSKSVIENKSYEPYILKELIEKGLMPPRDDEFVQKLDEFIAGHPLKYEKLKPVDYLNFERKLQEIAEVDKAFNKTPFELGQQLITLVDETDKPRLKKWLMAKGCESEESMARVFESWLNKKDLKQDRTKQKDGGYPPRGE